MLTLALLLFASGQSGADAPSAEIKNAAITAKILLPDPERGYYRGTRFDWSGVTASLRTKNHEYFGVWFPRYDPKLHDAIMGPVEEFRSADGGPGFAEAPAGGEFIRIGVGVVRKPDNAPYQPFRTYEIIDPGKWQVKAERNKIRFVHELKGPGGYAYRYTKVMTLVKDEPRLVIEHTLENTGTRRIATQQYNHNFFVMDNQPTGPGTYVKFPFDLKPVRPFTGDLAEVRGGEIHYLKELAAGQSAFAEFEGFGSTAADYHIVCENRNSGAGVRITGDRPISRIIYWSIRTVFSPEAYIAIEADPGKSAKWTYTYHFYDVPAAK
jgi:hypothetical protein